MTVLILAGTAEARRVIETCRDLDVRASLAGLTRAPDLPVPTRIGGFGGPVGFRAELDRVTAVLDATHPFAGMASRTARLCAEAGVPHLRLVRAPWPVRSGWRLHPDLAAAARALPPDARVFLAVGPGGVAPFLGRGLRLWCRRIDPAPPLDGVEWIIGRPGGVAAEERLLSRIAATHLVAKQSGGPSAAKLDAAERLRIAVEMVRRPALPRETITSDVAEAVAFVHRHAGPRPVVGG